MHSLTPSQTLCTTTTTTTSNRAAYAHRNSLVDERQGRWGASLPDNNNASNKDGPSQLHASSVHNNNNTVNHMQLDLPAHHRTNDDDSHHRQCQHNVPTAGPQSCNTTPTSSNNGDSSAADAAALHNHIPLPRGDGGLAPPYHHSNHSPQHLAPPHEAMVVRAIDSDTTMLHIPMVYLRTTEGLTSRRTPPFLCRLYLVNHCKLGAKCHQLHADPNVVRRLRAEVVHNPPCCERHNRVVHNPPPTGAPQQHDGGIATTIVLVGLRSRRHHHHDASSDQKDVVLDLDQCFMTDGLMQLLRRNNATVTPAKANEYTPTPTSPDNSNDGDDESTTTWKTTGHHNTHSGRGAAPSAVPPLHRHQPPRVEILPRLLCNAHHSSTLPPSASATAAAAPPSPAMCRFGSSCAFVHVCKRVLAAVFAAHDAGGSTPCAPRSDETIDRHPAVAVQSNTDLMRCDRNQRPQEVHQLRSSLTPPPPSQKHFAVEGDAPHERQLHGGGNDTTPNKQRVSLHAPPPPGGQLPLSRLGALVDGATEKTEAHGAAAPATPVEPCTPPSSSSASSALLSVSGRDNASSATTTTTTTMSHNPYGLSVGKRRSK